MNLFREQITYQFSALAATLGVSALAIVATYLRFEWHMEADGVIPWMEVGEALLWERPCGTVSASRMLISLFIQVIAPLSLVAGGVFGMEMWARYAHKALWHDYEPGWALHKSHHEPRTGPFEVRKRPYEFDCA